VDDPVRLGVDHVGARLVAGNRVGGTLAGLGIDDLDPTEGGAVDLVAE